MMNQYFTSMEGSIPSLTIQDVKPTQIVSQQQVLSIRIFRTPEDDVSFWAYPLRQVEPIGFTNHLPSNDMDDENKSLRQQLNRTIWQMVDSIEGLEITPPKLIYRSLYPICQAYGIVNTVPRLNCSIQADFHRVNYQLLGRTLQRMVNSQIFLKRLESVNTIGNMDFVHSSERNEWSKDEIKMAIHSVPKCFAKVVDTLFTM